MTDKTTLAHVPGEFQLDAAQFKTGNVFADGAIKAIVKALNATDANHDGISDVAELAPYVFKLMPLIMAIYPYIHIEHFIQWFVDHPFILDKAAVSENMFKAATVIED